MDSEKRPVGRPRTTVDDLPNDWQQIMTDCGQDGGSAAEARCLLGIGMSAWETLLKDSEEFREAEKVRQALCEVWWEKRGREMASGEQGNSAVWIFNMKNRFGWRDRHDINHESEGGTMTPKPAIDATKLSDAALAEIMAAKGGA